MVARPQIRRGRLLQSCCVSDLEMPLLISSSTTTAATGVWRGTRVSGPDRTAYGASSLNLFPSGGGSSWARMPHHHKRTPAASLPLSLQTPSQELPPTSASGTTIQIPSRYCTTMPNPDGCNFRCLPRYLLVDTADASHVWTTRCALALEEDQVPYSRCLPTKYR